MSKQSNIMILTVNKRHKEAVAVQKVLTEWGCLIKTRLGLHDGVLDDCSEHGLIILELVGDESKQAQMEKLLANLPGVKTHRIKLDYAD